MTELCPMEDVEFPVNKDGFVVNDDLPEACVRCLYGVLYGADGNNMLKGKPAEFTGMRIVDATDPRDPERRLDRHGVVDNPGLGRDSTYFVCDPARSVAPPESVVVPERTGPTHRRTPTPAARKLYQQVILRQKEDQSQKLLGPVIGIAPRHKR